MLFPQDLSQRSWERIGTGLRELTNSSAWWLADWLIFGEAAYGLRRYREAIERTGLDYQTLRNYAWVARRFEHHRRRDGLSFAHHAEVTRLSPPEQDYWLRRAEQRKWSRNELRRALREGLAAQCLPARILPGGGNGEGGSGNSEAGSEAGGSGKDGGGPPGTTALTIELPAAHLDHYAKIAASHGLPVGEWAALVLATAGEHPA